MIDVAIKSMEIELTGNPEAGSGFQAREKKLQE